MGNRSTSGDQTHLNPYASATQLMKPMVERSTPASRNHKESVPNTSSRGRPEENPRKTITRALGWR